MRIRGILSFLRIILTYSLPVSLTSPPPLDWVGLLCPTVCWTKPGTLRCCHGFGQSEVRITKRYLTKKRYGVLACDWSQPSGYQGFSTCLFCKNTYPLHTYFFINTYLLHTFGSLKYISFSRYAINMMSHDLTLNSLSRRKNL